MRLLMFDMDGTLIDSGALILATMAETLQAHGLEAQPPERVRSIIGLSLEAALVEITGCDAPTSLLLAATYRDRYRTALAAGGDGHEPLYAGALEALTRLSGHEATTMGIATGKGLRGVHRLLDLHAIAHHFATLQTPDHNPSKPHPGMLLRAMEETGFTPDRTVMIGDTGYDMALARAAGARAIGVTWGYHGRMELEEAGAHLIVESYEALDDAIDKVLS